MPITTDQYNRINARLTALEGTANDVITAQSRYATVSQVQELLVAIQTEVQILNTALQAVEARLISIEEEPLT
jgi:hypothetical protein